MSFQVRLPATSANLGPGFDALGLAMELWLNVEAEASTEFELAATGRDAEVVGALRGNLMVETYRSLAPVGPTLKLKIGNQIPLGVGCGSSAAALLAGVMLANEFGGLGMTPEAVLAKACRLEGHPDNVAACFYGGLTASAMSGGRVTAAVLGSRVPWRLLLALPAQGLATARARAMLPENYSRRDVVGNLQAVALLIAAFAEGRPELLAAGTRDWVHQPYRMTACPLLGVLLPLAGSPGFYSVTLSGAGPSVLLIADESAPVEELTAKVRELAGEVEVVETRVAYLRR